MSGIRKCDPPDGRHRTLPLSHHAPGFYELTVVFFIGGISGGSCGEGVNGDDVIGESCIGVGVGVVDGIGDISNGVSGGIDIDGGDGIDIDRGGGGDGIGGGGGADDDDSGDLFRGRSSPATAKINCHSRDF